MKVSYQDGKTTFTQHTSSKRSKIQHTYLSKDGVFYFVRRIKNKLVRFSLKTKCPETATMRVVIINYITKNRTAMTPDEIEKLLALGGLKQLTITTKDGTVYDAENSIDIAHLSQLEPGLFKNTSKEKMAQYARLVEEEQRMLEEQLKAKSNIISAEQQALMAHLELLKQSPIQPTVSHVGSSPVAIPTGVIDTPSVSVRKMVDDYISFLIRTNGGVNKNGYDEKASKYNLFIDYLKDHHPGVADDITRVKPFIANRFIAHQTAQNIKSKTPLAKSTQFKLNSFLKVFFQWCISQQVYFEANPFATSSPVSSSEAKKSVKHWEKFELTDIRVLFNKENYIKNLDSTTTHKKHPDYYWGPLIALFSGMRVNEISSLRTQQVVYDEVEQVYYFKLMNINDDDTTTTVKNNNSVRNVPVADILIELGFLDYVNKVKKLGWKWLFSRVGKTGKNAFSRYLSQHWNDYLKRFKIKNDSNKKGFHSFRHTYIKYLNEASQDLLNNMKIVGHTEDTEDYFKSAHVDTYLESEDFIKTKQRIVNDTAKHILKKIKVIEPNPNFIKELKKDRQ